MKKIFDIDSVIKNFIQTTKGFPFTILVALIGTAVMLYCVNNNISEREIAFNILIYCFLLLPITYSFHNCLEYFASNQNKKNITLLSFLIIITLLAIDVIILMKGHPKIYRIGMWWVAAHLCAAVFPFYEYKHMQIFWEYNKSVFINFLTAALYSFVLFLGLSGAIASLKALFSIDFDGEIYAKLFIVIAGIFNTYIFLGNSPKPLSKLFEPKVYPKGLRIFTQYILLSLVIIYLVILYAYIGKIAITQTLPNGWVCNLIIAYSVCSLLSFLLLHPLRDNEEYDWIFWFNKLFYYLLTPIIAMAFVAIGRRISDYGITEERYIVLLIAIWLAGITLYFIFSKKKNIITIPLSLMSITSLAAFGPWGIYQVSMRSQMSRLIQPLEQHHLLQNGKIRPLKRADLNLLDSNDKIKISGALEYLAQTEHRKYLKEHLTINIDSTEIFKALNIPYTTGVNYGYVTEYYQNFIYQEADAYFKISNINLRNLIKFNVNSYQDYSQNNVRLEENSIVLNDEKISLPLAPIFERFSKEVMFHDMDGTVINLNDDNNTFIYSIDNQNIELIITDMTWHKKEEHKSMEHISGYLLLP